MSQPQTITLPLDGQMPLVQGDTWPGVRMQVKVDGSPQDLNGYRVDVHLYQNMRKTKVFSTISGEITWLDQVNGQFQLEAGTLNLTPGQHIGDIQITDAAGFKTTYAKIIFNITKEYTTA